MTSIELDQNQIISSIEKINPQQGEILIFYVKTDDQGFPLISMDIVQKTADSVKQFSENRKIGFLFLMDKICLSSIEKPEEVIKSLKETISFIQEAIGKVENIKNGKFEKE